MLASLQVMTPATGRLFTPAFCRAHLRVDQPFEDTLITYYLATATQMAENYLNRALLTQTLKFQLGTTTQIWPNGTYLMTNQSSTNWYTGYNNLTAIKLPRSPVQSVSTVTRGFWGYDDVTLVEGTDYDVDLTTSPARVIFYNGFKNYPLQDHVEVTYTAGYGDIATNVPVQIGQAVLLILSGLWKNRGDDQAEIIPRNAYDLLSAYVETHFGGFHG
jgi:uncharacterized phiE125 gp8 family phage protein